MWYKYFITHIILVAAGGLWHLGSLFYHNTHYSQLHIQFGAIFRKEGTMHRPSHLLHLHTVPFLWPQEEHTRQRSWVDDFAGHCWLWRFSSRTTFVATAFVLPTNLGMGRSWLFPASSIKFLTRNLSGYI